MKKKVMAMIVFLCLMAVPFSTFALLRLQVDGSVKIRNEKNVVNTKTKSADSTNLQTFNSDIQQASRSNATENSSKVDDSRKTQDDETLNKNESTARPDPTETNQGQISKLPVPLPDGRIFLGAEDPIPYIPTENPKTASRIPIAPSELGS